MKFLHQIFVYHIHREIFFAQESVLVVPKLYINIPSCILRVIDNDSGEQMPMVFMRVMPRVLQKNKVIDNFHFKNLPHTWLIQHWPLAPLEFKSITTIR